MGFLDKLFGRGNETPSAPRADERPAMITVYDEFGRELEIPREEWRRKILPGHLGAQWSSADALYSALAMALSDGFAPELIDAAKRLVEIDANRERAACIYAIVLLENQRDAEAGQVLQEALAASPQSAALLTNLAKVYAAQGREELSRQTLWRALLADPNFENAVVWYGAIHHEQSGRSGYLDAMRRMAAIPGSWRASLWLAKDLVEAEQLDAARSLYEKALLMAADEPGVLMQISGDLGRGGYIDEVLDLVLPFYDPARHDPVAGFNFLQALLERGDWQRGEALLHELMLLDLPPYRERLLWYSAHFVELKQGPQAPQAIGELEIEVVRVAEPIWTDGLVEPQWLLPPKSSTGRTIAILALANTTPRGELVRDGEALVGPEDFIGRLTRAIPLHLADSLRFRTDANPVARLPIVRGEGMMVIGKEWDAESLATMTGGDAELVITGSVALRGEELAIELTIWNARRGELLARIREEGPVEELSRLYEACDDELRAFLVAEGIVAARAGGELFRPPTTLFREYLDGLGQSYALALAASKRSPGLYGERNIHRWLLKLALDLPEAAIPKIALVSALANSRKRGSQVYREIENETLRLFSKVVPSDGDVYRLTPMVFRLFDRDAEFESRRNELMHAGADDYVRWLASTETAFAAC